VIYIIGCPVEKYGKDCNQICPQNCYGSCHPDTGLCVLGCNDGWDNQYNNCSQGNYITLFIFNNNSLQ
jgi:hypothetical protein